MWYTVGTEKLLTAAMLQASGGLRNTCIGGVSMDTIPHHALERNPHKPYTIYALVEPGEPITWKTVRYIGQSTNVLSRYAQHLACRTDDANEDKSEWIQDLLREGKLPILYDLEQAETVEQARAREQYYIRYAMSQGADILNRQITYIGNEREEARVRREIRYAKIGAIIEQGIFVKRKYAWYPSRLLKALNADEGRLQLYVLYDMFFLNEQGTPCSVLKSSHEDFDAWIQKFIPVLKTDYSTWDWDDRISAINFARVFGKAPEFCDPPPQPEKKSRSRKK